MESRDDMAILQFGTDYSFRTVIDTFSVRDVSVDTIDHTDHGIYLRGRLSAEL